MILYNKSLKKVASKISKSISRIPIIMGLKNLIFHGIL